MSSILENINDRVSIRSYTNEKIPGETIARLKTFMAELTHGPFGSPVRFSFLDEHSLNKEGSRQFGTYGMITGDRYYIAGAAVMGPYAELDYGYCLERIVLIATELGLGTCWLTGTLNRSTFAKRLSLREDEIIPAISPVGFPADRKSLKLKLIETVLQVRKRKDFSTIFFDGAEGTPLTKEAAGVWAEPLEAVRSGPSASNKQPWRIVKTKTGFDFYLDFDKSYNSGLRGFSVQKIDMGIACCHFEGVARELNLGGGWMIPTPKPEAGDLMYFATWNCA
jgi:nitroreductase